MNAKHVRPVRLSAALVAPLLLVAPFAHAQVDCSKPGRIDYVRACQEAAKGMTALRQFRDARRGVYAIDLRDFEQAAAKVAKEEEGNPKVAELKQPR